MADIEADAKDVSPHDEKYQVSQTLPSGRSVSPVNMAEQRRKSSAVAAKIMEHSHDADEAMKAFANGEKIEIDEATNKRLVRRIDLHLMPLLCLIYGLNYLDKTTLSYASIMGIKKDINLVGDDYQWLGSMFYFGYLAWEYPTNRLLQRLPLAKYSAFCVIVWGTILALFATVSNFGGAVAIRCEFVRACTFLFCMSSTAGIAVITPHLVILPDSSHFDSCAPLYILSPLENLVLMALQSSWASSKQL